MATVTIKTKLAPQGPATAIELTDAQVVTLGGGKRAAVKVTIGKASAQLRLMVMGGKNLIGLSKASREQLGVEIGNTITATIDLDSVERTVDVPDDLAAALKKAKLRDAFDALAFTHRKEHVRAITDAKKPETRAKRVAAAVEMVRGNA